MGITINDENDILGLYYYDNIFYQITPVLTQLTTNSTFIVPSDVKVKDTISITGIVTDQNGDPIANTVINITVDGQNYTTMTDSNGSWTLYNIIINNPGNIIVKVEWTGNNSHTSFINTTSFNVVQPVTPIDPKPVHPVNPVIPMKSGSYLSLSLDSKKPYFVGQTAIVKWITQGIANLNQRAIIQFIENGKIWHTENVLLSDGQYKHKFLMAHKSLDIVMTYDGDSSTYGSSDTIKTIVKPALPDLIISKVKKIRKNTYQVTVKNQGKAVSSRTLLKLVCGCEKYSKITKIKSIKTGKTFVINVKFPYKGTKHFKYAIINYNKKVRESNYKNNIYKIGKI